MLSDRASFEVRCAQCGVSFPIETRNCVHCGSRTVPPFDLAEPVLRPAEFGSLTGDVDVQLGEAVTPEADTLETIFEKIGERARGEDEEADRELEEPAQPGSPLWRSMGSLIWIAALILFSITGKTCGG